MYHTVQSPRQPSLDLPHKALNYHFIFSVTKGTDLSRHQRGKKKMLIQKDKHTLPKKEFHVRQEWMKETLTSEAVLFPTLPPRLGSGYLQKEKKNNKKNNDMFISPMWIQNATSAWMHLYPLLFPTYPGLEMFWKQNVCKTVKYKNSEWPTAVTKPTPQRSHDVPGHPLQAIACNTMQISVLFKLVYKEHVFVYSFVCVCFKGFPSSKNK